MISAETSQSTSARTVVILNTTSMVLRRKSTQPSAARQSCDTACAYTQLVEQQRQWTEERAKLQHANALQHKQLVKLQHKLSREQVRTAMQHGDHTVNGSQLLHGYARGEVASLRAALKQRDADAEHLHATIAGLRERITPLQHELQWAQGAVHQSTRQRHLVHRSACAAAVVAARRAPAAG